jgi:hypothetical protein
MSDLLLSLVIGRPVPTPAPPPLAEALQSATITTSAGQRSGFQLTFGAGGKSPISLAMVPAGFLDPPARIILTAIVHGLPRVLMDGLVTRQDVAPSATVGASTLTVTGEDLTVLMDLERRDVRSYAAQPANVAVMSILGRYAQYGITPAVVPPPVPSTPSPTERTPMSTGTDLAYVTGLASDNGYVFYLEPGPVPGMSVAYWGPEVRIGVPQPALSLDLDAFQNVESLSFGYDGLAREQPVVTVLEPNSGMAIDVPLPSISLLRPPLALRPAPALRQTRLPDTANRSFQEAAALALSRAAQSTDAVTGSGQLDVLRYGHILRARQLVGVRGAGVAYDGLFYVRSVTHTIRPGEYKQSFQLVRDGLVPLTPAVPA